MTVAKVGSMLVANRVPWSPVQVSAEEMVARRKAALAKDGIAGLGLKE